MATIRRIRPRRWVPLLALLLLPTGLLSPKLSATDDTVAPNGLWRDQYGRLYCGGECNKAIGQVCCTFRVVQDSQTE